MAGYYFETLSWLPDGSAILVMQDAPNSQNQLVLRLVDPARPPIRLGEMDAFMIEPGGAAVLSTIPSIGSASVWTAEFVVAKKP